MAETNLQIHLIGGFQFGWNKFVLNRSNYPRRKGRDLLKLLSLSPGHTSHNDPEWVLQSLTQLFGILYHRQGR